MKTPITRAEIDLAYRVVLGRKVENDSVYGFWNEIVPGFPALIEALAASSEATARSVPLAVYADAEREKQTKILAILRKLRVFDVCDKIKVRLGRDNDGGYVMLEAFEDVSKAYSLGISDDVSWDTAVANRGIEVFQYDHTISALPDDHERFHWSKVGIEAEKSTATDLDTLAGLIERNTHQGEENLILKCDIKGSEWGMLAEADLSTLGQFKQIVVEVHFLGDFYDAAYVGLLDRAIAKLTSHHRVVHVHGNNCAPYLVFGGVPFPSVIELTLFRVEPGVCFRDSQETFPTSLDMPCSPHRVDLQLGAFRF